MSSPEGSALRVELAVEREWGQVPGWLATQPPETQALLLADWTMRHTAGG